MENPNQTQCRSFSRSLNNISKLAMLDAISSIGRIYAGFQAPSFSITYRKDTEWLDVYAHFDGDRVFTGHAFREPHKTLFETIESALVMLNDKIMRSFKEPQTDLSDPVLTALESEYTDFTDNFLSENESSDLPTVKVAS